MTYNTESHKKILDFLKQNKEKSFSAEEILAHVSQNGAAKSTVFRQLAKLSQNSEIKRIASASNRSVRYQFIDREHCSEHLHLKCSSCGRLIHLDDELTHFFEEKINFFALSSSTNISSNNSSPEAKYLVSVSLNI